MEDKNRGLVRLLVHTVTFIFEEHLDKIPKIISELRLNINDCKYQSSFTEIFLNAILHEKQVM